MRFLPSRVLLALLLVATAVLPALAEPETETEPAAPAAPADAEREAVLKFVDELREEAASIRGLEWKEFVPADLLTRDQLEKNLIEMVKSEITPEELERDTKILRRMGMLGPDEDPFELMLEAMKEMIGGYFHPEEKKLYLIAGMTGEAQKPVILHELIHALEDQYYDLKARTDPFEDDPDRLFAEKCLTEGSAEYARERYQEAHPDVAKLYMQEQQNPANAAKQMKILAKMPAFLLVSTLLHYQLGPAFVTRAVDDDFPGTIHALYEDGPISQEQLMHPERWFGDTQDYPQKVVWGGDFPAAAGEGWEKVHDMTSGELDLAVYLDFFLGTTKGRMNLMGMMQGQYVVPRAKKAAAGWDGGQVYFMLKEGLPVAWIEALVFDTTEDATEAADALMDVFRKANDGTFALVGKDASEPDVRTFDYKSQFGPGRLEQRGTQIIVVDGVPEDTFEKVWAVAAATTFEKDERDTWDPATIVDPFVSCAWVDRDQGIGVHLPGEDWQAEATEGMPGMVARAWKGDVELHVTLVPAPPEMVRPMIEQQLGAALPDVDIAGAAKVDVAGAPGKRYVGDGKRFYLGGAAGRTVVLRVLAPQTAIDAVAAELDEIAKRLVLGEV